MRPANCPLREGGPPGWPTPNAGLKLPKEVPISAYTRARGFGFHIKVRFRRPFAENFQEPGLPKD